MAIRRFVVHFFCISFVICSLLSCNRSNIYGLYRVDCDNSKIDTAYLEADTCFNSLAFLLCMMDTSFKSEICNMQILLEKNQISFIASSDTSRSACSYEKVNDSLTYIISHPKNDTLILSGKQQKYINLGFMYFRLKK